MLRLVSCVCMSLSSQEKLELRPSLKLRPVSIQTLQSVENSDQTSRKKDK